MRKRFFKVSIVFSYRTPCISFFTTGVNAMTVNPAAIGTTVNIKKKVLMSYSLVIESIIPPIEPAALFPNPIAIYHNPNIIPILGAGTNLDTYDNPTGDKLN